MLRYPVAGKSWVTSIWRCFDMDVSKRDTYLLPDVDGNLISVSEEVYKAWYKARRQERYHKEKDRKQKLISLERIAENNIFGDSMISNPDDEVEHIVINKLYNNLLSKYLKQISSDKLKFLCLLYADRQSLSYAARYMGWSRKKGEYWKNKLLWELREAFKKDGITEYKFY